MLEPGTKLLLGIGKDGQPLSCSVIKTIEFVDYLAYEIAHPTGDSFLLTAPFLHLCLANGTIRLDGDYAWIEG